MTTRQDRVIEALSHYPQDKLCSYLADWQSRDVLNEQQIKLELPNETLHGIARGIDAQGALLLEQGGQIRRLFSGEVSVRLAEPNN